MSKYRLKMPPVEARQLTGDHDEDLAILEWCGGELPEEGWESDVLLFFINIKNKGKRGRMHCGVGDWIIKDAYLDLYTCTTNDAFTNMYDAVIEGVQSPPPLPLPFTPDVIEALGEVAAMYMKDKA